MLEDPYGYTDDHDQRSRFWAQTLLARLFVVGLLIFGVAECAYGVPKAESEKECRFLWDLAITARSMAMENIDVEIGRRVIWRVYNTRGNERLREISNAVVDAAFVLPWQAEDRPGTFAVKLFEACVKDGDMDRILA